MKGGGIGVGVGIGGLVTSQEGTKVKPSMVNFELQHHDLRSFLLRTSVVLNF